MKRKKKEIELPAEKTAPVRDVGLVTMLLHGPPKIGKTTVANSFPDTLFIAAEEGLKFQAAYKVGVDTWEDFQDVSHTLRNTQHKFKTVCIDTAGALFSLCEDYVCRKHGIDHPSDEEWGKGWKFLREAFHSEIVPLTKPVKKTGIIRFGLIFTAHTKSVEVRGRVTRTHRLQADLSGTARKVLMPMVDVIGYCGFRLDKTGEATEDRVAHFRPSEAVEAGDRTGRFPPTIPMKEVGWYGDLQAAFVAGGKVKSGKKKGKRPKKRA